MATTKEIEKELARALREIGDITPWFDTEVSGWVFSHELYPVECDGTTCEEVVEKYPKYLREFILHRLEERLDPIVEKNTVGHGGKRTGAGRPRGSEGQVTVPVRLPNDIAKWIKKNSNLELVRELMACSL